MTSKDTWSICTIILSYYLKFFKRLSVIDVILYTDPVAPFLKIADSKNTKDWFEKKKVQNCHLVWGQ